MHSDLRLPATELWAADSLVLRGLDMHRGHCTVLNPPGLPLAPAPLFYLPLWYSVTR